MNYALYKLNHLGQEILELSGNADYIIKWLESHSIRNLIGKTVRFVYIKPGNESSSRLIKVTGVDNDDIWGNDIDDNFKFKRFKLDKVVGNFKEV